MECMVGALSLGDGPLLYSQPFVLFNLRNQRHIITGETPGFIKTIKLCVRFQTLESCVREQGGRV